MLDYKFSVHVRNFGIRWNKIDTTSGHIYEVEPTDEMDTCMADHVEQSLVMYSFDLSRVYQSFYQRSKYQGCSLSLERLGLVSVSRL